MANGPDSRIVISDYSGGIHVWNPSAGGINTIAQTGLRITDVAVAPNGGIYFITARDIYKLNVATGSGTHIGSLDAQLYAGHNGISFANGFDINNAGVAMISYADNSVISRVDLSDGEIIGRLNQPSNIYNRSAGDIWVNSYVNVATQSYNLVQFLPGTSGGLVAVGSRFTGLDDIFGLVGVPNGVYGLSSLGLIGFTPDSAYDLGATSVLTARLVTFDFPAEISGASLISSTFDDDIFGTSRGDVLYGSTQGEKIWGRAGADFISAGAGTDTLVGGISKDNLFGGEGRDVFLFASTSEMTTSFSTTDTIHDFWRGADKIDLSVIDASTALAGNNTFTFDGRTAHGTSTAGDVYFKQVNNAGTANDYTMIYIDNDADRASEAAIKVMGLHSFTSSDFIL